MEDDLDDRVSHRPGPAAGKSPPPPLAHPHPHPQQAHVRSNSSSPEPPQPNLEETYSLLNPTTDSYSLPPPTTSSRYPPCSNFLNSEHPPPNTVLSGRQSIRKNTQFDCRPPNSDHPQHLNHRHHPHHPHNRIPPFHQSNPYEGITSDLPNPYHNSSGIQTFVNPSQNTPLHNQSFPPTPSSPPSPSPPHPLSFVSTTPSSQPSYHSRAHNSVENLLPHSSAASSSSYNNYYPNNINRSGSPQVLPPRILPLLPTHSCPIQSPLSSPIIIETPDMPAQFHRQNSSQPSDHPSFNFLSQYSPPLLPPTHHVPYPFGQSSSLVNSVDEFKHSPNEELKAAYRGAEQKISNNAGYPTGYQAPVDLTAGKSSIPRRGDFRKFLPIGYRRLAIITLAGILLILAAVGIIVYTHLRRSDHPPDVTGDSDGDVVGQSGLGSARNSTASSALDPFNATNSAFGPDNGLRGGVKGYDSLVVFGASYCDNAHARPSNLRRSLKPPPYYKGRWSNGFVWNEYLSAIIGPGGRSTTLVNYAFGGATVDNTLNSAPVPDVEQQINAFLSDLSAQSPGAGPSNGKSLIAVWVGINSVTKTWNSLLKQEAQARSQLDVQDITTKAQLHINATVDHIFEVINNLIHTTAFKAAPPDLLLLPLPPAQLLLVNLRTAKGNLGAVRTLSTLNDLFNARFAEKLDSFQSSLASDQRVFTLDIPTIWHKFIEDPSSANLTVVDQPCLTKSGVCSSPDSYLFWDTLHPTTHIHEQLALMMASEIKR